MGNSARRAGCKCTLIDSYLLNHSPTQTLAAIAKVRSPLLYGFMINSAEMLESALAVIKRLPRCTAQGKRIPVVLGGIYPTLRHQEVMAENPDIDYTVIGEGEETFQELVSACLNSTAPFTIPGLSYRKGKTVVSNPPRTLPHCLDAYGNYDLKSIPTVKNRAWTISSSRGCSGKCSFCLVGLNFCGKGVWRGHSADWVITQLKRIVLHYKAGHVLFVDDEFIGCEASLRRAAKLAGLIKRQRLHFTFSIMCRPDTVAKNPALLKLLRDAGLTTVFLGVETANNLVLRRLNKGFTSTASVKAIAVLSALGIKIQCGNIVFTPWMTKKTFLRDLDFFQKALSQKSGVVFFSLNGIDIFGGTALGAKGSQNNPPWLINWASTDKKMYSVFKLWLCIERQMLYPALAGLGAKVASRRKELCLWQINTLRTLVKDFRDGPLRQEELLFGAFVSVCALIRELGGPGALRTFLRLNARASSPESQKELCFDSHF